MEGPCAQPTQHQRLRPSSARSHPRRRGGISLAIGFPLFTFLLTMEATMDTGLTRRHFLSRSVTFSVAACAACGVGGGLGQGSAWGQGKREIKFSHGTGLCNMPLFYAAEKKLFAKYGIEGTVVLSGWAGDQAVQLATGKV